VRQGFFSRFNLYAEFVGAGVILFSLYQVIRFFYSTGYLPPPFFDQSLDTFMDWYNTVYWGYRPGTYNEWYSVYPPFAFLFMDIFSTRSCYYDSSLIGRDCDPLGAWAITGFTIINVFLVSRDYWKADKSTAIPRTVALGLGIPALFAWERGNVIVPCFTFFILAHGRTLRSTWLRWICIGVTVNLKPYLLLPVLGRVLRHKWRWAEGCVIASILIYAASYMILGRGSPFELFYNTTIFAGTPGSLSLDHIEYATTYNSMLEMTQSQLPLMHFIGSQPMEFVEAAVPWAIKLGVAGVLICYAGAVWRPFACTSYRLAAMSVVLLLTTSRSAGGYAELFLIYFVFFERSKNIGQVVALVATYILCIPWDFVIVKIIHQVTDSYLSGRAVGYDFGLTLGAIVRPGLLLIVQYGLVAASLIDIYRARSRQNVQAARVRPGDTAWAGVAHD
jgi:hypothetical protein